MQASHGIANILYKEKQDANPGAAQGAEQKGEAEQAQAGKKSTIDTEAQESQ